VKYLSLLFVLMFVLNLGLAAAAYGDSTISRPEKNVDYNLFRLHKDEVTSVEAESGNNIWRMTLTLDEIQTLVGLLNKVRKHDIEVYRGPSIKGAPLCMILFLKSGTNVSFIVNADYILYGEIQAYQPEIYEFLKKIRKQRH
jgi:hypothetical protein